MLFIFPGQGSQFIAMGKEFCDTFNSSKNIFEIANDTLGYKISDLINNGPLDTLTLTQHAQPAILTTSIAILSALLEVTKKPFSYFASYVAGHSLGEYTALCAADSISLTDALHAVKFRGMAMSQSSQNSSGGMIAILGFTEQELNNLLQETNKIGFAAIANDNTDEQIVISGTNNAINFILEQYKKFNIKKAIKLNVSAPFHSSLIQSASIQMEKFLQNIKIKNPTMPIISNVTAKETRDPQEIQKLLVKQVTSPVRWRESMIFAKNKNVNTCIEIGPGNILSKMMQKINPSIKSLSIISPKELEVVADLMLQKEFI